MQIFHFPLFFRSKFQKLTDKMLVTCAYRMVKRVTLKME